MVDFEQINVCWGAPLGKWFFSNVSFAQFPKRQIITKSQQTILMLMENLVFVIDFEQIITHRVSKNKYFQKDNKFKLTLLVNSVSQLATSQKVLCIIKLVNKTIDISIVNCKLFLRLVIWVYFWKYYKVNLMRSLINLIFRLVTQLWVLRVSKLYSFKRHPSRQIE